MLGQVAIIFPEYWAGIHLPSLVPYVALLGIIVFILAIVPGLIWIERVVIALMQDRSGPNRVGPRGLLQTIADGVKLFFKEDFRPRSVDIRIYYLAPVISMIPALAGGAVLPLQRLTFERPDGTTYQMPLMVGNVNIGLLYILAMSSLAVYGVVLAGWSSNNKYSLLGGLRGSAQLISYELSMGLSLLCVIVMAGSLNLDSIVATQNVLPPGIHSGFEWLRGSIFSWYWLRSLFVPVSIFTIAMIAETNRAPFDLPEAESELIAGFHTEFSSMKFAMFFMGEYAAMLTISGLNAAMFWGGWLPPLNIVPFTWIPGWIWFVGKVMFGIFFYVWLRATLPRLRYDALMALGWKRMLPLALVWLFVMAVVTLYFQPINATAARPVPPVQAQAAPAPRAASAPAPLPTLSAAAPPATKP
ncbi:MAG TPA: NADH-quinone oxidoreductase subunit NuoH [Chthonomonadaceae bacterium]|nr:NADH-quinone oxidoreductase subunit NuoH [Chthonomonadaceae bacterium]